MKTPLLEVNDLSVSYTRRRGWGRSPWQTDVVRQASFSIEAGQTLAIVGESGSGKTSIGRAILGLAPVSGGSIRFDGRDVTHADAIERRRLAADLQVIFQNPFGSLNPSLTVGDILTHCACVRSSRRRQASISSLGSWRASGYHLTRRIAIRATFRAVSGSVSRLRARCRCGRGL